MNIRNTLRAVAAAGAVLVGMGAVGGTAAHAAGGCAGDCITSVGANVYADDLGVQLWTSEQATVTFTVWDALGHYAVMPQTDGAAYYHTFSVWDKLTPGTYYFYQVDAKDAYGNVHTEYNGFTTRNRTVTFTIDKIVVTNDSDALSAGEFWIAYKMGPAVVKHVYAAPKSVSSGSTWYFSATQTVSKAPQNFTVAVELQDDDGGCGWAWASWNNGSSTCIDWSTAAKTFVIPSTNGSGNSGTVSFSVNSYVGFTVYGHYSWVVA